MKTGFDNEKYLHMQSSHIRQRIAQFGDKLYLEFGGKLFDDYHASRVLPGFEPDSKLKMLLQLKDQAEIVSVISAAAIASQKAGRSGNRIRRRRTPSDRFFPEHRALCGQRRYHSIWRRTGRRRFPHPIKGSKYSILSSLSYRRISFQY